LGVLEGAPVAELEQVPGLVDLALEPAEGGFDRLAVADGNSDLDAQFGGGGAPGIDLLRGESLGVESQDGSDEKRKKERIRQESIS